MSNHGDFALALQIDQKTLQQLINLFHRGGLLPRRQQGPITIPDPAFPSEHATLHFDVFMDAPVIKLNAGIGFAQLEVRLVGPLTILAPSCDEVERQVRLRLIVHTAITGTLEEIPDDDDPDEFPRHELRATFSPTSVTESSITRIGGPPLPTAWKEFFSSDLFRAGVGFQLASVLADVHTILPDELLPVMSTLSVGRTSVVNVTSVIGNGFLTFGLDVHNDVRGVHTAGNAAAVSRFLSSAQIALIVSEATAPLLARRLRLEMNNHAGGSPVTELSVSFEDGYLSVEGHAETSQGIADFSLHATPHLGRPAWVELVDDEFSTQAMVHPASDEIWVDLTDLELDAAFMWWVYLTLAGGGLMLGPIMSPVGASQFLGRLVSGILLDRSVSMVKKAQRPLVSRVIEGALSGPPPMDQVEWRMEMAQLAIFPDRALCRATLTADAFSLGHLTGPTWIAGDDLAIPVSYVLENALLLYDIADPELRVRWQVRRLDTNEVVQSIERVASAPDSFVFYVQFASLGASDENIKKFSVSARVYRLGIGMIPVESCNESLRVTIDDRLDRDHPYCWWEHRVVTPVVEVRADGTHERKGKRVVDRRSVIHRTCVPGRCKFVSRFTLDIPHPQYLDDLPFELAELAEHRAEVCDYCFYGGPDKTVPLVGPPTLHG